MKFKYTKHDKLKRSLSFFTTPEGIYYKDEFLAKSEKASVYKFKDEKGEVKKVVKQIPWCDEADVQEHQNEVEIYRKIHGFCEMDVLSDSDSRSDDDDDSDDSSKKTVYILTDYIDAETLEIKLSEARDPFEIFTLLFNVVTAVKKFNLEWIHGDLHTENILIDAKGNVFLIDFESTYKPNKIVYGDIKWIIKIFDETLSSYNKNIGLQIEIKDLIKFIEQSLKNEAHSLESLFTIVLDDLAFLKKFSCEIFNMACQFDSYGTMFSKIRTELLEEKKIYRALFYLIKNDFDTEIISFFLKDGLNLTYKNICGETLCDVTVCSSPEIIRTILEHLQKNGEEKWLISSFEKMANEEIEALKNFEKFYPAEFKKYMSDPTLFSQALSSKNYSRIDFFLEYGLKKPPDFEIMIQKNLDYLLFNQQYSQAAHLANKYSVVPDFKNAVTYISQSLSSKFFPNSFTAKLKEVQKYFPEAFAKIEAERAHKEKEKLQTTGTSPATGIAFNFKPLIKEEAEESKPSKKRKSLPKLMTGDDISPNKKQEIQQKIPGLDRS